MTISARATITVEINGQKFELTKDQAETLYNALGNVLNKGNFLQYPPGVRGPITSPNTTPWSPPYTITCGASREIS